MSVSEASMEDVMKAQTKKRMIGILKSRFTIIAASLLVIYTLAGFFLVPFLIGHFLPVNSPLNCFLLFIYISHECIIH